MVLVENIHFSVRHFPGSLRNTQAKWILLNSFQVAPTLWRYSCTVRWRLLLPLRVPWDRCSLHNALHVGIGLSSAWWCAGKQCYTVVCTHYGAVASWQSLQECRSRWEVSIEVSCYALFGWLPRLRKTDVIIWFLCVCNWHEKIFNIIVLSIQSSVLSSKLRTQVPFGRWYKTDLCGHYW